ncbi:hypothetical protein [Paenibacillus sp. YIM B09110]|uniref:hypothetical protein n=1 Tax=Paenibacillus sp. YIM B09110 TaxID=3126102 RepID=UPI00301DFF8F
MKKIEPDIGIDQFILDATKEELLQLIDNGNWSEEYRSNVSVITYQNYKFWIHNETKKVNQILVFGDYSGKFLDQIGIGDTLSDIKNQIGTYYYEEYVYKLEKYPGICFELFDCDMEEEWGENNAPIEYITVYKVESNM